jgi:autotransporter-associated beta strand protein
MKPTRKFFVSTCLRGSLIIITLASITQSSQAVSLYWDSDGTTAGAGVAPTGAWGVSAFWSTNSGGTTATANTLTTADDDLFFSAGTTAAGSFSVTTNGVQNARLLTVEEGTATITAGTINLGKSGGITLPSAAGNLVVGSNLTISGNQSFLLGTAAGASRNLTLNTGSFTRNPLATLNIQSISGTASTLNSTQANFAANNVNTGIVGPWASFGSGANTRYATFTGSLLGALTGTTAADGAALIDTVGTANYDLVLATGNVPADVSANTIRYQGAAGTTALGATSFKVNGLINSGTGVWTLGTNPLTIGGDLELVVNTANNQITISSSIQNNSTGASAVVKTGTSQLNLSGVNTYTGITAVNQGTLNVQNSGALGSVAGTTTLAPTGLGSSARLLLANNITCPENFIITGTTEANAFQGAIENNDANINTLTGSITLAGNLAQRIGANSGTLNLEGPIAREAGKAGNLTLRTGIAAATINVKNGIDLNGGGLNFTGPLGTLILTAPGTSHDIGNTGISVGGSVLTNSLTIKLGINDALPINRTLTLGFGNANSTSNGGILDLAGFNQTLPQILSAAVDANTTRRKVINSSGTQSVLSLGNLNTSSTLFSGTIDGNIALSKLGAGILTIQSSQPYTGSTTIAGGKLSLTASGTVGAQLTTSPVTVTSGILEIAPAVATTVSNSLGSDLTLNAGSSLSMVDNFTNALIVGGNANLYSGAAGVAPQYNLEIGAVSGSRDSLAITGAASFANPGTKLIVTPTGPLTVGASYTVATASSGLDSPNAWALPASGRVSFAGVPYLLSLTNTSTQSVITVQPTGALVAFYTGAQGDVLNATSGGGTNWSTGVAAGDPDLGAQPSAISDINFSNNLPSSYEVAELGQNYTAYNLNFIDGPMTLNDTAGHGFNINSQISVSTSGDVTVNVPLLGDAGLTKSGTGVLALGGNNSYLGTTNLNAGLTIFSGDNSSASGPVNIAPGATLRVSAPNNFPSGVITMGNTSSTTASILQLHADGSMNFNKSIVLGAGPAFQNTNYNINVNGADGGSEGNHTLDTISQATPLLRIVTINGGFGQELTIGDLKLAPATGAFTQITSEVPVTINDVSNPMTGFGVTNFNTLNLNGGSTGSSILGVIEDAVGGSLGAGGTTRLTKQGSGTWTLLATNTYTGVTAIDGGKLVVNGSTSPLTPVTVAASGTLSGSGTVAGIVTCSGKIAPGDGLGTLNTGPVSLPGTLEVEISGVTGDKLQSSGSIALSGSLTINLQGDGFTEASYVIAQGTSLTGTFSTVPEGYAVTYTATQAILAQSAASAYDTWISSFTNIPVADRDPGDDPDSDGSSNLLEFALNGIPDDGSNNGLIASLIQDSSAPVGSDLSLVIAVRDGASFAPAPSGSQAAEIGGISYSVQGALDLVFPSSSVSVVGAASDTAPAITGFPSLSGTDWEYRTFKLDASEGLAGKGFLRVNVTQP